MVMDFILFLSLVIFNVGLWNYCFKSSNKSNCCYKFMKMAFAINVPSTRPCERIKWRNLMLVLFTVHNIKSGLFTQRLCVVLALVWAKLKLNVKISLVKMRIYTIKQKAIIYKPPDALMFLWSQITDILMATYC